MSAINTRVLFLCVHNSARSQMAAASLKQIAGDRFDVESAGLEWEIYHLNYDLEDEAASSAASTCCAPTVMKIGRRP
jgi:protein-tyrosine-phosphatase